MTDIDEKLYESGKRPRVIDQDKVEHWAFGFIFTLFGLIHPVLIFSGMAFGVGKELYDWKYGDNGADIWDLVATFIGAGCALIFLGFILLR